MAAKASDTTLGNSSQPTIKDLDEYRFIPGDKSKLAPPEPCLSLNGVPLCTAGNISNIQGQAKSAKSSVLGAAMAAMLRALTGTKSDLTETLGFTSNLSPSSGRGDKRKVVLHFDTEQSGYHHHKLGTDILTRAGIANMDYAAVPFDSYSLICIDLKDRRRLINAKIEELEKNGDELACLVLDGVADLISDPNNAEESFGIVTWLHDLAYSKQCVVLTIIHENPGSDGGARRNGNSTAFKPRGHLGSQIQRKSETNLRVLKQSGEITKIWTELTRGEELPFERAVSICWHGAPMNRHLLHDPVFGKKEEGQKAVTANLKGKQLEQIQCLEDVLQSPLGYNDLVEKISKQGGISSNGAKKRIKKWRETGWIIRSKDGYAIASDTPEC